IHLLTPTGAIVTPETYNKLFTMHGVAMIFFFLIPSIPAVLGNFLIPLMIGAKDLAFPKVNLLSWYIYILGGSFVLYSFGTGGLDTGWTFYTPLSSVYSNSAVTPAVIGIFINGFSSILTGLNFIVTIHTMRAPGMTWFRLPLFAWAHYATSIIFILCTPVIAITLLLAAIARMFHLGFFHPPTACEPLRDQRLPLDLHAIQRCHLRGRAHALCPRLHWPVYHWPTHRALSRLLGPGHSHPRHLLWRCPLPLHHGWRCGHGLR